MRYRVVLTSTARRELRKLERVPEYRRLFAAIADLAADPRPPASKKLTTVLGYRLRVGDYRVLYEIDDVVYIVDVQKVGHRRDVYE